MTLKLISWNVNGLRSIYNKGFVNFLKTYAPDIICLQEAKATPTQLNQSQLNPLNYNSIFSSATKTGYSGVACYYKKSLRFDLISTGLGNKLFDNEGRYLVSKINGLYLYNLYFPSGTTGETRQKLKYKFLDHFFNHLKNLPASKLKKVIICGDFNICHKEIDIHHPKQATKLQLSGFLPKERAWMDKFIALGFTDTYRNINGNKPDQYTWWSYRANARNKNLGWRIDYFFIHKALQKKLLKAEINMKVKGSDHCPIGIELSM